MSESQSGAGRREVAYRLFAAEFDEADFSYSESDEERAPNYVVTPTGGRVNRLFVVGVLTEIETVSEDYLRARVVDPTGPFVVYAGQYQPEALAFLERAEPPLFVAVTGKARTYQPDDSDRVFTSVRPETISEADAATRDRWVVQTAERTVERVARTAEAKHSGLTGDDLRAALEAHGVDEGLASGITVALDHYGTTGEYLAAIRDTAVDAARVVAGEIDEADSLTVAPDAGGDDPVAGLVERPIDVDALDLAEETDDAAESDATSAESEPDEATVAEVGAGNGSAVGTAESSGTESAESGGASGPGDDVGTDGDSGPPDESTATETTDVDSSGSTSDTEEPGIESGEDDDRSGDDIDGSVDDVDESVEPAAEPDAEGGEMAATQPTDGPQQTASPDEPAGESTGSDDATGEPDDLDDFEPEFDLDDDEREEIEAEFGTEFQSGTEVDEPGEADIDAPDPEAAESADVDDAADAGTETTEETTEPTEGASDSEDAESVGIEETDAAETEEADAEPTASDGAEDADRDDAAEQSSTTSPSSSTREDVDLEDAVMDAMTDLDEGDGADRDAVLAAVVDRTGADPGEVEDAVQDALMGGRCYEPDDETLKPI